jgi:hypothetical protein
MQGLQLVPEPLWWLLGAIVSFYFGARELHHQRTRILTGRGASRAPLPPAGPITPVGPGFGAGPTGAPAIPTIAVRAEDPDFNPAVEEWRALRG